MGKSRKKRQFTAEQIVSILKQADSGVPVAELSRQHGFSQSAYDTWRKKYAGGDVSLVREHRRLSRENAELKKKLAEALLDNKALKYIVEKK